MFRKQLAYDRARLVFIKKLWDKEFVTWKCELLSSKRQDDRALLNKLKYDYNYEAEEYM
jgi:hypothetical protein